MTYTLLALVICLLVLLMVYRRTLRVGGPDDLASMAAAFARYSYGVMPFANHDFAVFGKVVKGLNRDKKRGRELYSFENWLRDNDYLVERAVEAVKRARLHRLPQSDGTPRVVTLARYIVKHTDASSASVGDVLREVERTTPLFWREYMALADAIRLAAIERLAAIAKESLYLAKARRMAASGADENCTEDAYIYYCYAVYGHKPSAKVDLDGVKRRFWRYLLDLEAAAKAYLGVLQAVDSLTPATLMKGNKTFAAMRVCTDISRETVLDYLGRVGYLSERYNVQETNVVHLVEHIAATLEVDFAEVLYDPKAFRYYLRTGKSRLYSDTRAKQRAYLLGVLTMSIGLALLPLLAGVSWVSVTACILAFAVAYPFAATFVSWFVPSRPKENCRMGYNSVPEEGKTVVVVSRYVNGSESLADAVDMLRALSYNSPRENLHYCLLVDFPKANEPWREEDEKLLNRIKEYAREDGLGYAVRRRVKDGDKYVARERKRGAILQYLKAVVTGDTEAFVYVSDLPRHCVFAVLLDDDSRLLPMGVLDAVNRMMHPACQKYDVMAFDPRYRPQSIDTAYALRYADYRGVSTYPTDGEFYSDAFDTALYTGKGIVRISSYLAALEGAFPEGRVLSHDLIEGAILHTGRLRQVVYEDIPRNYLSDIARRRRWQRGDVLLSSYLAPVVRTAEGKRVNPIMPIYKGVIWGNLLSVLRPFAALAGLFLAALIHSFVLALVIGALYLAPFLPSVLCALYGLEHKRARYVFKDCLLAIWAIVEDVLTLPFRALDGLCTVLSTCFRSLEGRNMLSWQPFYTTQKSKGFGRYLLTFLPSIASALAMGALSFDKQFAIYMLATCAAVLFLCDERVLNPPQISEDSRKEARDIMQDTYRYFVENAPYGLVADNVQIAPKPKGRDMTSPTDLGFAVLAEVVGLAAGLDGAGWDRLADTLRNVAALPNCRGHLYNWYSVDGRVLERVVSTVDSANFLTCILCAESYAKEAKREDIVALCAPFLTARFSDLFDYDRNMLYNVWRVDEDRREGHYDTLASEARLAYYLAAAEGLPISAYLGLARDVTSKCGNTLLSWGGTAFEYLLPRVFIMPPVGSLLRHAERNASRIQHKAQIDGLYGISESCFYAFNDQMRYRYRANGVDVLAMHPDCGLEVVSPYASALTAAYLPNATMRNLLRLKARGAYGVYGFYEAVEGRHVVQTYMAHHQGMLLSALANATMNNRICRLFMDNPRVQAATLLLGERNIERRVAFRSIKRNPVDVFAPKTYCYAYPRRAAHALQSGPAKGVYLSDGRQELYFDDILVGAPSVGNVYPMERVTLIRRVDTGEKASPYPLQADDRCDYRFEVQGGGVAYRNLTMGVCEEVRLSPDGQTELRRLTIDNPMATAIAYEVAVYMPLVLSDKGGALSHRAYRDMFVHTSVNEGIAVWREEGGARICPIYMSVEGLDEVRYESNRRNIPTRNFHPADVFDAFDGQYPHEGAVLYPAFIASGLCTVPPKGQTHIYVCCSRMMQCREETKAYHRELKASGAIDYYGLAECLGEQSKLFDKYADDKVAETVASCLLDNKPSEICLHLGEGAPKVLSYTKDFRTNLTYALAVRLLAGIADVRLSAPPEDKQGALCASIAERINGVTPPFTPCSGEWHIRRFSASIKPPSPKPMFVTGEGAYVNADTYVVSPYDRQTKSPYANVVATASVGFVLDENGGGYFFGKNSRQNKWCYWRNDSLYDFPSHVLGASDGTLHNRLTDASFVKCTHAKDYTAYETVIAGDAVRATYRLVGNKLEIRVVSSGSLWIYLDFVPLLDWRPNDNCYLKKVAAGIAVVANAETGQTLTFSVKKGEIYTDWEGLEGILHGEKHALSDRLTVIGGVARGKEVVFELSESRPQAGEVYRLTQPVGIVGAQSLNLLMHGLWRQLVHSRLNAKTSFYQCGGAFGYRDQLQDFEAYLLFDTVAVRRALLTFAEHQYAEGDVMHWWHPPRTGVRTLITDDRLFLVEAACRYVEATGDTGVLDEQVGFLLSDPLPQGVASRYETPTIGREKYPLREHLRRAIYSVMRYGVHDLLLVEGGDWNDGVNRIGLQGKGESVWLSMFAYMVVKRALPHLASEKEALSKHLSRLRHGIRKAFVKDRFLAYYTDDGQAIGGGDGACGLYLMTQSFAMLSGAVEESMARLALQTAKRLVDYEGGIIKLFSNPFVAKDEVGYIADYPSGIRENGGQYTHAAVWYIRALISAGEVDYAYELVRLLNPIERCANKRDAATYGLEPYVLSADVYAADGYHGVGGWSWYTGSAGWLYRVIVEDFYGLRQVGGTLTVRPRLPKALVDTEVNYLWQGRLFHIYFTAGDSDSLTLDGEEKTCILPEDYRAHIVCTARIGGK